MKIAMTGSYPKGTGGRNSPDLKTLRLRWERGEIQEDVLLGAYQQATRQAIREQEEAGTDIVTDGLIRWEDPLALIAARLEGMELGKLQSFLGSPFFYRQPVVVGRIRRERPLVLQEFVFAMGAATRELKQVIPGPVTMAYLSEDRHYGNLERMVYDLSEALSSEILALEAAGAAQIQVDEPVLGFEPGLTELVRESLKVLQGESSVRMALHTYFGDIFPALTQVASMPVDAVGLDMTQTGTRAEILKAIEMMDWDKDLALGCVNGCSTELEDPDTLKALWDRAQKAVGENEIYVGPQCGMGTLTRAQAWKKLNHLSTAVLDWRGF
ncbi:MAG: hypothetical protein JW937_03035 [Candidatus Omnitrophica bacterium]|nr:hypothetical protein [Candidatus Omnitrophota bacterium]